MKHFEAVSICALVFLILTGLSFFWRCDCCRINADSGNYQNKGFSKESEVCMHFCNVTHLNIFMQFFSEKFINRKCNQFCRSYITFK